MTAELPGRSGKRQRQANVTGGRSVRQEVKLTVAEAATLHLKARKLGVSVPRLLVESALTDRETATDRRELLGALFGLHRLGANIANNVNQLARKANFEDEFPVAARPVLEHVERLLHRLDAAIDEVGGVR